MSAISSKLKLSEGPTESVTKSEEYNQLALEHKALNLGQAFPDYPPPKFVTDALAKVAKSDNCLVHQYTRGFGHPRLVSSIAKLYSQLIGREINPQTEVLVTLGAFGSLFSSINGNVDVGDEVIIIEPFFACYESLVRTAGGVARFIPLRLRKRNDGQLVTTADWVLDKEELEDMFNSKTKIIILNTPHNPLGKVFKREELESIADLCKKWNVLCISDEVYEWIVYKPNKHFRIATFPGMWERTITIGSAGKTFGVTGWKVGWAYGPANLMVNLQMVHQSCVYMMNTPIQEAVAISFEKQIAKLDQDECYFNCIANDLKAKRDYMAKILHDVGMEPTVPEGGYVIWVDWSFLEPQVDLNSEKNEYKDVRFVKWMTKHVGLQGIPSSVFCSKSNKILGERFVRYCFCKKNETLLKAGQLLNQWRTREN